MLDEYFLLSFLLVDIDIISSQLLDDNVSRYEESSTETTVFSLHGVCVKNDAEPANLNVICRLN